MKKRTLARINAENWVWGILVTLAMFGVILGGLGLMFCLLQRPRETREPIDRIGTGSRGEI